MKILWNAIAMVLLVNVLTAAAFALWMRSSGRLNRDRVQRVVQMFQPTIEQEKAARAAAESEVAEQQAQVQRAAWIDRVSEGADSTIQRVTEVQADSDRTFQQILRQKADVEVLVRQLDIRRQLLEEDAAQLEARRKALEQAIERERELREDEDFQAAVTLLEKQPPKQAKQVFQELLADGQTEQVVEYLAAMQERTAAKVLKEFKTDAEVKQATLLLEQLRKRGQAFGEAETNSG